jgi:DnaJ-class molecular chaperone
MKKFVCPYCKGTGRMEEEGVGYNIDHKCGRCNGTGRVDKIQDNEK